MAISIAGLRPKLADKPHKIATQGKKKNKIEHELSLENSEELDKMIDFENKMNDFYKNMSLTNSNITEISNEFHNIKKLTDDKIENAFLNFDAMNLGITTKQLKESNLKPTDTESYKILPIMKVKLLTLPKIIDSANEKLRQELDYLIILSQKTDNLEKLFNHLNQCSEKLSQVKITVKKQEHAQS